EFFGFLGPEGTDEAPHTILRNRIPVRETDYLTEAFTRESLAFIDRHRASPFFLVVSYNAPHVPLLATPKYLDRFKSLPDGNHRIYAAMVSAMDDGVGVIVKKIHDEGLSSDTIIIFLSDNGCALHTNACSNAPLLGGKFLLVEGGIRVRFMIQWAGSIAPGTVCRKP